MWLILFIIISALVTILTIIPIVRDLKVFKRGREGIGTVVNISSFYDMSKKEISRISVEYGINNQTHSQTFNLAKEESNLKTGDKVALLYDLKNPKNAHISADYSSCSWHFQKLIIMMMLTAILTIGLRSILLYFNSANNSSLLSIVSLGMVFLITIIILIIYIYIHIQLLKSRNTIVGEIIGKIDRKNSSTYKVKYSINKCFFMLLFNSNDNMEIGDKIKVSYLVNAPFIAHITKQNT